jgi:predicted dienelactone hydrolase
VTEGIHVPDYDPYSRGPHTVGVRTTQARDAARNRLFPWELWYPADEGHAGQDLAEETQDTFTTFGNKQRRQAAVRDAHPRTGTYPLILFSHHSGGHRRAATFLCTQLCSHGYVVAALDHSEIVAPDLARQLGETEQQKLARWDAVIASRVPDLRFLLDYVLETLATDPHLKIDASRIGAVGHSFGAWTVLAVNDVESRIRAVVALAPGGARNPRPGILPVKLEFKWERDIPTLFMAAENDACLPLAGMYETFDRLPARRRLAVLRRADHMHFMDHVEEMHEAVRTMPGPPEFTAIQKDMLPISELCSGEHAQRFVRGLTAAHFDAFLRSKEAAERLLAQIELEQEQLHSHFRHARSNE